MCIEEIVEKPLVSKELPFYFAIYKSK